MKFINDNEPVVIISSPPAAGKSSLLRLLLRDKPIDDAVYEYVKMEDGVNPFKQLDGQLGIHFFPRSSPKWEFPSYMKDRKVILLMDDVQTVYNSSSFWSTLFRSPGSSLPNNFVLVMTCTHLLSGGCDLSAYRSKLGFSDFVLTKEESHRLILDGRIGLHSPSTHFTTLRELIVNDCNGHIGSLRITIDQLNRKLAITPLVDEKKAILSYFNLDLPALYRRCWSLERREESWDGAMEKYLEILLADEPLSSNMRDEDERLERLVINGFLKINDTTRSLQFSSQLSKRFFCQEYYSDRAASHQFKNLQELARMVVSFLSARDLAQSAISMWKEPEFPDQSTFLHLFMKSVTRLTMESVKVLPQLEKTFPCSSNESAQVIPGQTDFLLKNGDVDWGVELLISGRTAGQHIDRFAAGGAYEVLGCDDHIVIDFRWGEASSHQGKKDEKRMTVFFNSHDFKTCQCVLGNSDDILSLELM